MSFKLFYIVCDICSLLVSSLFFVTQLWNNRRATKVCSVYLSDHASYSSDVQIISGLHIKVSFHFLSIKKFFICSQVPENAGVIQ